MAASTPQVRVSEDASSSPGSKLHSVSSRNDNHADQAKPTQTAVAVPKSVSFPQMFRFSTPFELLLDVFGVIAAIGAGALHPLLALMFGNLTQVFVSFDTIINAMQSSDPSISGPAQAAYPAAVAHLRSQTAIDALHLVYLGIALLVCAYVVTTVWMYTGEVNAKRIREQYLRAVLRQNIAWFDNVGAGEIATRIETDTHSVQQGLSEKVGVVFTHLSAFVTGFVLAYIRSWRLALAMSSILPCICIAGGLMTSFVSKYMQLSVGYISEGGTLAEEVFSTVRTAQAFGNQKVLSGRYEEGIMKSHSVDMKGAIANGCGLGSFFFVIYCGYALAFDFGMTLTNRGEATAGIVVNVILSVLVGSFSLGLIAPEIQALTLGMAAAGKLFETIDRVPEIDSSYEGGLKPDKCVGEITFEDVQFSYPARADIPIFKQLSIKFPAGKTTALVGASGSGKSTTVSLVERFYDPLSGCVRLDGTDIKELNLTWLRSQIGYVAQEPTLFATTIQDNIAHGLINTVHEHASEEKKFALIKEACIKANADGFISKLPLGYKTLVGERGFLLSGGQKQRIAIARAIVSDPRVLLLDEATSALDTQSEGIVQNALDKAAAGRTTITIAHRLSTIKDADCIYVMGNGLVLESGTHDQLLQDENGAYARLVAAQGLREAHAIRLDSDSDTADSVKHDAEDYEKELDSDISLSRLKSNRSLDVFDQNNAEVISRIRDRSIFYILYRYFHINRDNWYNYLCGLIAAICNGASYPAFGIVFAAGLSAFSDVTSSERQSKADRVSLWLFVIAILSGLAMGLQNYFLAITSANLSAKMRVMSFQSILRQDVAFFDKEENNTGHLTANLSNNPQKVTGLTGVTLATIIQALSTLVVGAIIGLIFAWKVGLVGIACIPLLMTAGFARLRTLVLKAEVNKRAHQRSAQLACEAAGAIRTVASLTREADCCALYSECLEEPLRNSTVQSLTNNALYALSQAMSFFMIALVFWYGSHLVSAGEISVFHYYISLMGTVFGAIQAGDMFGYVPDFFPARTAAVEMLELFDIRPEIDAQSTEGVIPTDVQGQIRFENVHFQYPTRPGIRVLHGLNLTVEPGTYVALVGPSGCGKSTTIQLIERFYNPSSGNVYLDGKSIADYNVSEYRKNMALVSQEPTLYSGTIRFNILLGATKPESEVTEEEIVKACRNANILDFIKSLPQGFDTEVGGKGSQLSGGQKQRIAIARALLRNPKVLLLDEATSALDSNSERVVQDALDQAAKGRTTIAIAHRLSTIQNADRIYFIKDGAVSESGTHDELLELRGDYYEYVQLQALNKR